MLGSAASSKIVPHSIVAPSLRELHRRMLLNNLRDGRQYQYFDIQKDGTKWVAFFTKEATGLLDQMLQQSLVRKTNQEVTET